MSQPRSEPFWRLNVESPLAQIACSDGRGISLTYAELEECVAIIGAALAARGERKLGIVFSTNTLEWLCIYLASLRAGHVPLLLPANIEPSLVDPLLKMYPSAWTWRPSRLADGGKENPDLALSTLAGVQWETMPKPVLLDSDLALLLSTSGSTGSAKLVRLSYGALAANAESIVACLEIQSRDRALTTMPCCYAYGLSVINSHLAAGACVVVQNTTLMGRDFQRVVQDGRVSSLAGVPAWYQMLMRTGFDKVEAPCLRALTQAGGALDQRTKRWVLKFAEERGLRFFVMYGQTEATARISYVPPEALADHLDSIGLPIPGGNLQVDPETSELIYSGPNVMMGYAASSADLSKSDELHGVLRTGDVGVIGADGFIRVTGRLKRFVKLSGSRFGLDEIESKLIDLAGVAVAVSGRDERLGIWIEGGDVGLENVVKTFLQEKLGLHHSLFRIFRVALLPMLPSGKRDYPLLLQQLG